MKASRTDPKDSEIFIGVDPGYSGGIAIVWAGGAIAHKMPETEKDILDCFSYYAPRATFSMIERVHSMPKQGVASSFKFGMSYGGLRMAMIAAKLSFETCTPQKWQRYMQCLTGGDKNVSKAKAQELFPHIKITHAIADSLLIAEYARRIYEER